MIIITTDTATMTIEVPSSRCEHMLKINTSSNNLQLMVTKQGKLYMSSPSIVYELL